MSVYWTARKKSPQTEDEHFLREGAGRERELEQRVS